MPGREQEWSELIADLTNAEENSEKFRAMQESIRALDQEMTSLMMPDASGWKLVDSDRKQSLIEKYEAAARNIQDYLAEAGNAQNPEGVPKTVRKLQEYVHEDLATIRAYNPAEEEKSLPSLLEDARCITLETNERKMASMSGQLSSRIPMKINLNGKTVQGVFTVKKVYDPAKKLQDILYHTLKKVPKKNRERAKEIFDSVVNSPREFKDLGPDVYPGEEKTKKGKVLAFMHNALKKSQDGTYSAPPDKVSAAFGGLNGLKTSEVKKILGSKALEELSDTLIDGDILVNGSAGIPEGADITKRNVAMSRIADLFGVPEVIARSHVMKIKSGDKIVEGVFMEKAQGIDRNHPDNHPGYVARDPFKGANGDGLRQAADLQIVDFIGGNIDRHTGNMFYQFDGNGLFSGLQGIDNDASCGMLRPKDGKNHLAAVKNLQLISESMARKIMNTSKEQLRFALHGLIEEKCIDAACERLQMVKDELEKSKKRNLVNLRDIDPDDPPLIPLKKEGFFKGFAQKIVDNYVFNNIFRRVRHACEYLSVRKNPFVNKGKDFTMVGNDNRATRGGVYAQFDRGNMMYSALKGATSRNRTSPNYEAVVTAVDEYRRYQAQLLNRMKEAEKKVKEGETDPSVIQAQRITGRDFAEMQKRLRAMKEAANTYRTQKLAAIGGEEHASKYEKKRLQTVNVIEEFADKSLELRPEEKKEIDINQRRTVEEVVRAMNREQPQPAGPEAAPTV